MSLIRFEYKTLGDGRFHVITSPDLKGLHVTADTRDEAEREAVTVARIMLGRQASGEQRMVGVAFEAA